MKSLYIIAFSAISMQLCAQQDKKNPEIQEAAYYKESKAFEAQMMKEAKDRPAQKSSAAVLVSEQGLDTGKPAARQEPPKSNSGKLLPATAGFEEIMAAVPGNRPSKTAVSSGDPARTGRLKSTPNLSIREIRKTIPRN